jgi:hypothetical protein
MARGDSSLKMRQRKRQDKKKARDQRKRAAQVAAQAPVKPAARGKKKA